MTNEILLKGGRVLDPAQDIDRTADVLISDNRIHAIGEALSVSPEANVLDVSGKVVCPGFIDVHVHTYGGIAFADPDSIGVNLGTTTMCDAGGAGAYSWDEFEALIVGQTRTDIYLWLLMGAAGIFGFQDAWKTVRSLIDVPINTLLDIVEANRETIVGLKMAGFAALGLGPIKMAKGTAEVLELPLYMHIGDIFETPDRTYTAQTLDLLTRGDYVTHCFTPSPGNLLGTDGKLLPAALRARDRGVLFDVGFGSFNFGFDTAERVVAQGIVPSTISSDLQQVNITGPTFSLTHVMSAMMLLGMSLRDVVERVTINPARQLGLTHKMGSLTTGLPADVTVIEVREGRFDFSDAAGVTRKGQHLIVPVWTIKGGEVIRPDREKAEQESNWSMESALAYDSTPPKADSLDHEQRLFLARIADGFRHLERWEGVDLHWCFHRVRNKTSIGLREAAEAVLYSFMTSRFTPPIGFFLATLERDFVLARLDEVSSVKTATVHN